MESPASSDHFRPLWRASPKRQGVRRQAHGPNAGCHWHCNGSRTLPPDLSTSSLGGGYTTLQTTLCISPTPLRSRTAVAAQPPANGRQATRPGRAPRHFHRPVCAGPQCAPTRGSMDDQNDSKPASRSRRPPKRPQQFMFIDSTGANGVNAKPDKNVRSFVMKSARSKKPWSTRQKEKSASPSEDKPQIPKPDHSIAELLSPPLVSPSWQHAAASPTTWSTPSNLSPVSSRNGSVLSTRSRSQPYLSPPSSSCSLCDNPRCAGDLCTQPHASNQLVNRRGFAFDFIADLDCLPVPTDSNTRDLLENCKPSYLSRHAPFFNTARSRQRIRHKLRTSRSASHLQQSNHQLDIKKHPKLNRCTVHLRHLHCQCPVPPGYRRRQCSRRVAVQDQCHFGDQQTAQ